VTGRVKWFDAVKGYGFIKPASGEGDVLLHPVLRPGNPDSNWRRKARMSFAKRVQRAKGFQAVRVVELDNGAAAPDATPRASSYTPPHGPAFEATVKMVQPRQGLWLRVARTRCAGRFRAYGNIAPFGDKRTRTRPARESTRGRWSEGPAWPPKITVLEA